MEKGKEKERVKWQKSIGNADTHVLNCIGTVDFGLGKTVKIYMYNNKSYKNKLKDVSIIKNSKNMTVIKAMIIKY